MTSVNAYGNTWVDPVSATAADLQAQQSELNVVLPRNLGTFLCLCGGGSSQKNFYDGERSDVLELALGYVIPLREFKKERPLAHVTGLYRKSHGLPANLIPFAYDLGHANLMCLSMTDGCVYYWLHDDPDDAVKFVADSLEAFLSGLGPSPF